MTSQQSGAGESEEKAAQAKPAEEKNTVSVDSKIEEGIRFYRAKNWKKALEEFRAADISNLSAEEKTELAYYYGLCYTKLERYDDALSFLEQVVTSSNDILRIFQCRMTLAYIYVITKRLRMAEYELRKLQNSGFESPLLFNTLAYAAWLRKQHKNAVELYEKTLEIDSGNATAMNSMGYILADTGMDVMRALRLCRRAVDAKPQNAAYLDSLGWAYFKSGELVEARTWLRRALDAAPDEEEIKRHFRIVSGAKGTK